jgi:predicted GNAT family N-acyltransferase
MAILQNRLGEGFDLLFVVAGCHHILILATQLSLVAVVKVRFLAFTYKWLFVSQAQSTICRVSIQRKNRGNGTVRELLLDVSKPLLCIDDYRLS